MVNKEKQVDLLLDFEKYIMEQCRIKPNSEEYEENDVSALYSVLIKLKEHSSVDVWNDNIQDFYKYFEKVK